MKLSFPHGISEKDVHSIRSSVQGECQRLALPPQSGFIVLFVIDELCCNLMEHSKAGWSELHLDADTKGFKFTLKDDGIPFNTQVEVKSVASKSLDEQDSDRNLGLSLIGRLVDKVNYQRTAEGLNHLELLKAW